MRRNKDGLAPRLSGGPKGSTNLFFLLTIAVFEISIRSLPRGAFSYFLPTCPGSYGPPAHQSSKRSDALSRGRMVMRIARRECIQAWAGAASTKLVFGSARLSGRFSFVCEHMLYHETRAASILSPLISSRMKTRNFYHLGGVVCSPYGVPQ